MFISCSNQNQTLGDKENLLVIQFNLCYILFIFIALGGTSFSCRTAQKYMTAHILKIRTNNSMVPNFVMKVDRTS